MPTKFNDADVTFAGNVTVQGQLNTSADLGIGDDLAITGSLSAADMTLTDAASVIVPGATSFAIRNNANDANNLLISDAGVATVRAGLTVTTGGATVSAGSITMGAAASKIVPGATSLSLRNNADSADNVLVSDAGVATVRAGVVVTAGAVTMGAAASQVVPGATSFSVRNNANDADNLLVSNAGVVTARAGIVATAGVINGNAGGIRTSQPVTEVHDTAPTIGELTTAFGDPATLGRGFVGTVDDNDGDTNFYIVAVSDASFYFLKMTKASA